MGPETVAVTLLNAGVGNCSQWSTLPPAAWLHSCGSPPAPGFKPVLRSQPQGGTLLLAAAAFGGAVFCLATARREVLHVLWGPLDGLAAHINKVRVVGRRA